VEFTKPEQKKAALVPWWGNGDFYMLARARDGRSAFVPGAADFHRQLFLTRAATIEPQLLESLRQVAVDDVFGLALWATRWNLTDRWCLALAHDTLRWYATQPEAGGWQFEGKGICAGFFPFPIKPLEIEPFYFDPTQRRRKAFKRYVLERVAREVDDYCDKIEAAALAAGLKRTPRKQAIEHFDWLARHQVKNESFAFIARNVPYKFTGGRQTIRKAVVQLADYLKLTLRTSTS
jgi:hypothetical protein